MLRSAIVLAGLMAAPALASSHFQAEPAVAPIVDRIVARDTIWNRNGPTFEAGKSNSRPAVVCAVFVKQVGALKSFRIAGAPIAADDLQKCNARARR